MSRRGRAASLAAFLALVCSLGGVMTHAHSGHPIVRSERYLKFDVSSAGVRLVVSETLGSEEFLRSMRRADANHDGVVSRSEADSFLGDFANTLRRGLPVRLDGGFVRVEWDDAFLTPLGPIRAQQGTIELVGRVRLPPGQHTLFLTDDTEQETIERTDVAFLVRDGVQLIASGASDAPTTIVRALAFGKGAEAQRARTLGLTVVVPDAAEIELPTPPSIGMRGVVLLLFAWTILAVAIGRLMRERKALRAKGPRPI